MKEKIIKILEEIKPEVSFAEEQHLISMEIVQFVMELSEEFDIEISPMEIVPENFESVDAIANLVEKCLNE